MIKSLKNKVDSIRRTLKNHHGLEIAGTLIESKILEMCPEYPEDWCPDLRTEIIKSITKDMQSTDVAPVNRTVNSINTPTNSDNLIAHKEPKTHILQEETSVLAPPEESEKININASGEITLSNIDKRILTLQKSQELGIKLSDDEINFIADSVEHCGEILSKMLDDIQSALIAYIDYKTGLNNQKIDSCLDSVVTYAESKFHENSQHLSNRLKTLANEMEAVATRNKSHIKSILSRLAVPTNKAV